MAIERDGSAELGTSLIETLGRSDLATVATDLTEVAIDAVLEDGILKDVPFVGTLAGLWKTGVSVRDYLLMKKVGRFLAELKDVPRAERREMIGRLQAEPQFGRQVGDNIMLLLDRLDTAKKAELVGRAFRAYCQGAFDAAMLARITYAIDRVLIGDLQRLPEYVNQKRSDSGDDVLTQAFMNAGLAVIDLGAASTSARPNTELCTAIVKYVLTASPS